jgi:hypothetical protein
MKHADTFRTHFWHARRSATSREVLSVDRLEARQALERADSLRRAARGSGGAGERLRLFADELEVGDPAYQLASTSLRSLRPAAAREATSTSRRLASSTATASAARASPRHVK